jgi:predicted secreted hydrolase
LFPEHGIGNTYWEGTVQYKAAGSAGGLAAGVGYLEMTGYAKPVHF